MLYTRTMRKCSIPGCGKKHDARGYCSGHYQKWRVYGDPLVTKRQRGTCSLEGCERQHAAAGYCSVHYYRLKRTGEVGSAEIKSPAKTGRYVQHGYVLVKAPAHHPRAKKGWIREHILVMEDKLGRHLEAGEQVHHVNGVKDDNRPENLELWVISQPPGQRPADLVEWAKEILRRYGDESMTW